VYQGGRLIGTAEVDTNGWKPENPVRQDLSVSPIGAGIKLELPNVYYNFNDATLRPDARKDLDMVVAIMKQQPRLMVEIASHTDARGTFAYNDELSQRRAAGVVRVSGRQGNQLQSPCRDGYGETEPRNRCKDGVKCSEPEYARNRRTEIRVTNAASGTPAQPSGKPAAQAKPSEVAANDTPVNVNTAPAGASGDVKNATERGFLCYIRLV
jgi:outer membrane protein OmpA-like peptidoglycan-associated protein